MKTILLALLTILFSFTPTSTNPIDRIGVKGPLEFNKTSFKLAWTDHPRDNYYIQEYLPLGEKLESFNQMLTMHLFVVDISPKDAAMQKVKELTARKKTDPVCNFNVIESPNGKELIVDFLLGASKENKMTLIEFNVYHYKQIEVSINKKALIVYAYSKRSYGNEITHFLKTLEEDRTKYLNQMISSDIPTVTLETK